MIVFVSSTAQCHKTLRLHKLQYSTEGAGHPVGVLTTAAVRFYLKFCVFCFVFDQNLN